MIDQTVNGLENQVANTTATIMVWARMEHSFSGRMVLPRAANEIGDRFINWSGGHDIVANLNTLFKALRQYIILFAPTLGSKRGGVRGFQMEANTLEQIFGEESKAVLLLRRIVGNRAKMYDKERIRLIRENPIRERATLPRLRNDATADFTIQLEEIATSLLNSTEYEIGEKIAKRRNVHRREIGLILDDWVDQPLKNVTLRNNITIKYGSEEGIKEGRSLLYACGFIQVANTYLLGQNPYFTAMS